MSENFRVLAKQITWYLFIHSLVCQLEKTDLIDCFRNMFMVGEFLWSRVRSKPNFILWNSWFPFCVTTPPPPPPQKQTNKKTDGFLIDLGDQLRAKSLFMSDISLWNKFKSYAVQTFWIQVRNVKNIQRMTICNVVNVVFPNLKGTG